MFSRTNSLIVIALISGFNKAEAEVRFVNLSSDPVYVSRMDFVRPTPDRPGNDSILAEIVDYTPFWRFEGWWSVPAGGTLAIPEGKLHVRNSAGRLTWPNLIEDLGMLKHGPRFEGIVGSDQRKDADVGRLHSEGYKVETFQMFPAGSYLIPGDAYRIQKVTRQIAEVKGRNFQFIEQTFVVPGPIVNFIERSNARYVKNVAWRAYGNRLLVTGEVRGERKSAWDHSRRPGWFNGHVEIEYIAPNVNVTAKPPIVLQEHELALTGELDGSWSYVTPNGREGAFNRRNGFWEEVIDGRPAHRFEELSSNPGEIVLHDRTRDIWIRLMNGRADVKQGDNPWHLHSRRRSHQLAQEKAPLLEYDAQATIGGGIF